MPLLRNGRWADDNPWERLEDDTPYSPEAHNGVPPMYCSLQRFLELEANGLHMVAGVWLKPEDDVTQLADHLQRIQMIAIDFPQFTDGRGYSQARLLRTQLGFAGELRATGDIRPDQLLFMVRAGIDTFNFPEKQSEELISNILKRHRVNYQPSYQLPIAG